MSGSTNWNEYYQFDELQSSYNNNSVTARLTQPLFRLDSWFNFRRSKKLTDASEADFAYAQQNLIIRTVEKYFGVLRAIDNLNAAVSEEKAIKKQRLSTQEARQGTFGSVNLTRAPLASKEPGRAPLAP